MKSGLFKLAMKVQGRFLRAAFAWTLDMLADRVILGPLK
jgi:hypothetical protein